jgi:lysyl-tRNA synthetase class I
VSALVGQANETQEGAVSALRAMGHLPAERGEDEVGHRIDEATRWLGAYAPGSALRIELQDVLPPSLVITEAEASVFGSLAGLLRAHLDGGVSQTEDSFKSAVFGALHAQEINPREFFVLAYRVLLGRPDGPAMSPFLLSVGARALPLLDEASQPRS